jgi:peptidoglycan hydrolase-like protein with peptidoglycan-binding domain
MNFVGAARPLHSEGLSAAAAHVGVDPAVLWSVVVVETSGCGFLPDRRPSILFERHVFSARTKRRFDDSHPQISGPAGGYGPPGSHQYDRLIEAIACDRCAALESASWGLGQIMGFNAPLAGYRDAEDMVARMLESENEQILGMVRFMASTGIHKALQQRDWTGFARRYNGPAFASNRYDEKLAANYTSLTASGLPDLTARAVQLLLTYHGFNAGKVDGIVGERTRAAITAFATQHKFPATGDHRDLYGALLEMLPAAPDDQIGSSSRPATPRAIPDLRLVQSLLEHLGWGPGPVDGRPGPRTRNAIARFEQSRGAVETGEPDAGLLAALAAEATRGFAQNRIADTRLIQRLLAIRGFDPGDIDGLVGPRTRAAIAAFAQSQVGSPTDALDAGLLNALLASDDNGAESRARA